MLRREHQTQRGRIGCQTCRKLMGSAERSPRTIDGHRRAELVDADRAPVQQNEPERDQLVAVALGKVYQVAFDPGASPVSPGAENITARSSEKSLAM
jgi:hypothetical protein